MQSGDSETAQAQLGELQKMTEHTETFCQNRIVNTILHVKNLQYRDQGIRLECQCSVPEALSISGVDLCSLFSNLLDNAANGVSQMSSGGKTISLSAKLEGNVFVVRCENPYPGGDSLRPSHRPDGHGLGLSILEDLTKQYHGKINTDPLPEIFRVTLWLVL